MLIHIQKETKNKSQKSMSVDGDSDGGKNIMVLNDSIYMVSSLPFFLHLNVISFLFFASSSLSHLQLFQPDAARCNSNHFHIQ